MDLKRHSRRIMGWFSTAPFRSRPARPVPVSEATVAPGTGHSGDRLIRAAAVLILLGVAAAAAYVSYHHFYGLALQLGERHDMAILYPAMSDGVIVMASLVMVYCSRRRLPVPVLAWVALAVGGAVTLVANVAHGWSGGMGSRLLSALAPVAFVGAYELLMWLVRTGRAAAASSPAAAEPEHVCHPEVVTVTETVTEMQIPVDRYEAARLAYEDSLEDGRKRLGRRALATRWGLESREAEEIIAEADRDRQERDTTAVVPSQVPVPHERPALDPNPERHTEHDLALRTRITAMRREALMDPDVFPTRSVNGSAAQSGTGGGA